MSNILVHIADRVINRPLMVTPEKLAIISQVLEGRIGIDASELREIVDADRSGPDASRFVGQNVGADKTYKPYRLTDSGIAVISVIGSLVNRGAWIGAKSGMTSYEGIAFQLATAAADPEVMSVILDIDSPGGEAVGAFEVADAVRALAKTKEVIAMVNGVAASAAYAIASAATSIVSTPSGVSGSIGVVLLHADYSHQLHEKGIVPTLIHAGARKTSGSPYKPLTDDVKAELKAEVDQFYDLFVSSVARGRKGRMTDKSIRGTEARTYIGAGALEAGLVDAIGSFEGVLSDLSGRSTARSILKPKGRTMSEATYTQPQLDASVLAAVNTAKAEATEAAKIVVAAHDTALQAAVATATKEAATAERARIQSIMSLEEAKGREPSALHFAMTTDLSADAVKAALVGVPKASAPTPGNALGLFVEPGTKPAADKADPYGWNGIVADLNKEKVR